jgi:hypothetical protein
MTSYARQKRYRDKRRAEGLCITCDLYTPINPKTERPYWYCRKCRIRNATKRYQAWRQSLLPVPACASHTCGCPDQPYAEHEMKLRHAEAS